jgi:MFS family permease
LAALAFATEGAILDWSSIYLRSELGAPTGAVGFGFAAFSGTMAIGRLLGDRIRTRIGGATLVRAGAILALLGLLLGPATGSVVGAIIGFAVAGAGLSNIVPVLFSRAGASPNGSAAIATVATLGYAGLLAAPPLLGFVAQARSIAWIFIVAALMCIPLVLAARWCRAPNR